MSPRPRQATGRPGTAIIPKRWETAHAAVLVGALRGRVSLADPDAAGGEPVWENDQWVTTPAGPYATAVPARVQRLAGQARTVVTAEDNEVVVDHLVQVPADVADVREGHLVTVTDATDPQLVDQVMRVEHVAVGTERFTRDLFCTLT